MIETLVTFTVGFVFGALVRLLGLPGPAPPTVAGMMAVIGIFAGFVLVGKWQ